MLHLNRHQAWKIALRIELEVGIRSGNATVCLLAYEHLDGATSMGRTTVEDHLDGFHSSRLDVPCDLLGYRSEWQGEIGPLTEKGAAPKSRCLEVHTTYTEWPRTKSML